VQLPTDPNKPYPTDLVFLFMEWMQRDVSSTQAPECFSATLRYLQVDQQQGKKVCVPAQQTVSRWRQALGAVAFAQSAITVGQCRSYTLGNDLGSLKQLKLGTCPLRCVMPNGDIKVVALGGVFSQAGGTAKESMEQILAVFVQAEALLVALKKLFVKMGLDHSWIPNVEPGTLGRNVSSCSTSDHANAALLTNNLLAEHFSQKLKHSLGCQDHSRVLVAGAATAASDAVLKGKLGPKEVEEFNDSDELTSSFMHELYLYFHDPTYAFGDEAGLKRWMKKNHPGVDSELVPMLMLIGNRNDAFPENAGIVLHNMPSYVKRLLFKHSTGKELNALERKILKKAGNVSLLADLRAQAIFFFTMLQPFREAANSTKLNGGRGRSYLQMSPTVQSIERALEKASVEGFEELLSGDLFADDELKEHSDKYKEKHSAAWKAAQTLRDDVPEQFERELQKTMAVAMLEKLRKISGPLCKDGKYANPTAEVIAEMESAPPTNRLSESLLGIYKYLARFTVNASHFTYSGLVAAKLNHTCEWMNSFLPSWRDALVQFGRQQGPVLAAADKVKLEEEEELALEWENDKRVKKAALLRQRRVDSAVLALREQEEHATTTEALEESTRVLEAQCKAAGRTEAQIVAELKTHHRLQINLWKRKGVPKLLIPIASYKDLENPGKRKDHSAASMAEKLAALIVQVSEQPTLLVPVTTEPMQIFLNKLSYRGVRAAGVVRELLEAELAATKAEQATIAEEAAQLYKTENEAKKARLAPMSSNAADEKEPQAGDEVEMSDEEPPDETESDEEESDDEGEEQVGPVDGVAATWQGALPQGAQLLTKPRTWKSMKNKQIVLCGHTVWYVGKIAKVERRGLVTMRVDGVSRYQELELDLYGTTEGVSPGMWSLFRSK
jgi:hypothetical protein